MNKHFLLVIAVLFLTATSVFGQKNTEKVKSGYEVSCIAFYNLENLFDTIDDPITNDQEFLPEGGYHWNTVKYRNKQHNMAYAISKMCERAESSNYLAHLAVLGVSEVENRAVLEDLVAQPEIAKYNFQIIHKESPDRRGIDVGLLYNPRYFQPTKSRWVPFEMPERPDFKTRDQLVVSGYLLPFNEKIHVIVNHWPSRYGGEEASRPNRAQAARITMSICDSIYARDPKAKIIIMGDLNDDPINVPCAEILNAKKDKKDVEPQGLYNTMWKHYADGNGTLMYQGSWNLFDQIIISGNLANANREVELTYWTSEVFNAPFLTEQTGKSKGGPLRTTSGGVWTNGYSDHFPTMIYVFKKR
ncbi:MAG: endonuclease/exonuclease/phosphatase family protein [Paludibacteraceae bacterium]|nr:endonuclease/exonuclease/phosphatase family protein [Paludibacteraceae bacterium]